VLAIHKPDLDNVLCSNHCRGTRFSMLLGEATNCCALKKVAQQ
jgi:hypothetical protein